MKSGFCPKCESNEVKRYSKTSELKRIMQDGITVSITDYVCLNCGYMESYLSSSSVEQLKQRDQDDDNDKKKKRDTL